MNAAAFGELVALAIEGPRSAADAIRWGMDIRSRIKAFELGDSGYYTVGSMGTDIIGLVLREVRSTERHADELLEQMRAHGASSQQRCDPMAGPT